MIDWYENYSMKNKHFDCHKKNRHLLSWWMVGLWMILAGASPVTAQLLPTPDAIDFGEVITGETGVRTLTLQNTSNAPVDIVEYYIGFPADQEASKANDFSVQFQVPVTLSPGQSVTMDVLFSPIQSGEQTSQIVFLAYYLEEPLEVYVSLYGFGDELDFLVSPASIAFGEISVGQSTTSNIEISNIGLQSLHVDFVRVVSEGEGAEHFVVDPSSFDVLVNTTYILPVTYAPQASGFHQARVEISINDPSELVVVSLSGSASGCSFEISTTEVPFGDVPLGTSVSSDVFLRHNCPQTIDLQASYSGAGVFAVNPLGSMTLDSNQDISFKVTFTPDRETRFGSLTIQGPQTQLGTITVSFSGRGVWSDINLSPASIDFGSVLSGQRKTENITIRNSGTGPLLVSQVQVRAIEGAVDAFEVSPSGFTVNPGVSRQLPVTYIARGGSSRATVEIHSNDPDQPVASVGVTGSSTCSLTLSASSVAFQDVPVGQTATREVRVSQNCGQTLSATASLAGSNTFSLEPSGNFTLGPSEQKLFVVSFKPVRGNASGTLTVASSLTQPASQAVPITGRGVAPQIALTPAEINFGTVSLGREVPQTFTIANTTTLAPLTVTNVLIEGTHASDFQVSVSTPFSVGTNQSQTLTVRFKSQTQGERTAQLVVVSNDPDRPRSTINLRGRGQQITLTAPTTVELGTPVEISLEVPDDLVSATGTLFFQQGGALEFQSQALQRQGNTFLGTIPAGQVSLRGIAYYATFSLGSEQITIPQKTSQIRVHASEVSPPTDDFEPSVYRMVSFPVQLQDALISTQLVDDYGTYNPSRWRVLRWSSEDAVYREFPQFPGNALPGRAFWLITEDGTPFDLNDGFSQDFSQSIDLQLDPGWSQIGNPFAFPIAWAQIENHEAVQGPYFFNGQEYLPNTASLVPWEGYFVFNPTTSPITLVVPPHTFGPRTSNPESGSKTLSANFPGASYWVQLRAEAADLDWQDTQNYLGFSNQARTGWDLLDLPEPPAMEAPFTVRFLQNDKPFTSVFKSLPKDGGAIWDVEISAPPKTLRKKPLTTTISLIEHGSLPEGFEQYVFRQEDGREVARHGGAFSATLTEKYPVRRFQVKIGTKDFFQTIEENPAEVVQENQLMPNYPNPFTTETNIQYKIMEVGDVEVSIYNLLGQRVRKLVDERKPGGTYEVTWDGRDDKGTEVASGVYICRMKTAGFTATRTMLRIQ